MKLISGALLEHNGKNTSVGSWMAGLYWQGDMRQSSEDVLQQEKNRFVPPRGESLESTDSQVGSLFADIHWTGKTG